MPQANAATYVFPKAKFKIINKMKKKKQSKSPAFQLWVGCWKVYFNMETLVWKKHNDLPSS